MALHRGRERGVAASREDDGRAGLLREERGGGGAAHAAGAADALEGAHARFIEIGGSAVERGVFENLWLHALIGSGRKAEAATALDNLRARKGADHVLVRGFEDVLAA